jgi:hypothetical protein
MIEPDKITKWIGVITASFAVIGGGYTAVDKVGIFKKPVLTWAPEHFSVTDGYADGQFKVVVAREKHRDCSVEDFKLEVRDSDMMMHKATPSIAKFSGPASEKIDKFGYKITIDDPEKVSVGRATLMAQITYTCPEGKVLITYPDHQNLYFNILGK